MAWVALNCPQCSAPLPRVAIWRSVKCPSCGALITRTESMVMRDTFRQALVRARQGIAASGGGIQCGGESYQLMQVLGNGEDSQVYLALRMGTLPFLAMIKLSSAPAAAARYTREAQVLRELQGGAAGDYGYRHLPVVVGLGAVEGAGTRHGLVTRYADGYWGSMAALNARFPDGLDPRHTVWIWRRMLDVLHFVHAQGWAHGDVRPEHALVHPRDHGVRLTGWASAKKGAGAHEQATDLLRSARVVLILLCGANGSGVIPASVPDELAQLVKRASEDEEFCRQQGAGGLDALLQTAARAAFGAPSFVPLTV